MKRKLPFQMKCTGFISGFCLLVFNFILPTNFFGQPCNPSNFYFLDSQADVDNFQTNFGGPCTSLQGTLFIQGPGIFNLDGLAGITAIEGDITIRGCTDLLNIDGLSDLTTFTGTAKLRIHDNPLIQNIDGLSNLSSVGGELWIYRNDALENLNGLVNITAVPGSSIIQSLPSLTDASGFGNITSVGDFLEFSNMAQLTSLNGLSSLTSVGTLLGIRGNDSLTDISGLANLTSIGDLELNNNPMLSDCCILFPLLNDPINGPSSPAVFINAFGCNNLGQIQACSITPTISQVDENGDGIPDIADPCSCTDPLNVGDPITLFHDFVAISSNPGETWVLSVVNAGEVVDANGTALPITTTVLTETVIDATQSVYRLDFFHPSDIGFDADFARTAGGSALSLNAAGTCSAAACPSGPPPANDVPTLGEWGLIILFLLLVNIGSIALVYAPQLQTAGNTTISIADLQNLNVPFHKNFFFQVWLGIATTLTTVLMLSVFGFGYEMTNADIPCGILASGVFAFWVQLFKK